MKKIFAFVRDIFVFRSNPAHIIQPSSYYLMRRLDIYSLGFTTWVLKWLIAPQRIRSHEPVARDLRDEGFSKLGNFNGPHLEALMRLPVYCRANHALSGMIDEVEPLARDVLGRLDVQNIDFLRSKAITQFIVNAPFAQMARQHYGGDVVCVRVSSWWSIPTTNPKNLDGAAQKFHRDIDWLGELKFFVFATDVNASNGPFDFIRQSHRKRFDRYIRKDGRIEEEDMFHTYDPQQYLVSSLCNAGDAYAVDTRGYHRGRPVIEGRRCVLCVEFSLNKFGVEWKYGQRPALDPAWESYDTWQKAIAEQPAWAGLFSASIR